MKFILRSKLTLVLIIVISLLLITKLLFFKKRYIYFTRTFGGSGQDIGSCVQLTRDGGYVIVGKTGSFGVGGDDVYLIKTDELGNLMWERIFGGPKNDVGNSVQQTKDGGYIILEFTYSFGAIGGKFYLVKTDSTGSQQWQKTLGGEYSNWGFSVRQTYDGGYILVGESVCFDGEIPEGALLIKTDSLGNIQWGKVFSGLKMAWGSSVALTHDSGYIITGRTWKPGQTSVYLIKTDLNGNCRWEKIFTDEGEGYGASVQETTDGGYIVAGWVTTSAPGRKDIIVIKTDSFGNIQWREKFGDPGREWASSVKQTRDGGYIVVGITTTHDVGGGDIYLIKLNPLGKSQWFSTFGGSNADCGNSVLQTQDGGYVIAGETNSFGAGKTDVCLIKTDPEGILKVKK
jgi:hypothetical protein